MASKFDWGRCLGGSKAPLSVARSKRAQWLRRRRIANDKTAILAHDPCRDQQRRVLSSLKEESICLSRRRVSRWQRKLLAPGRKHCDRHRETPGIIFLRFTLDFRLQDPHRTIQGGTGRTENQLRWGADCSRSVSWPRRPARAEKNNT